MSDVFVSCSNCSEKGIEPITMSCYNCSMFVCYKCRIDCHCCVRVFCNNCLEDFTSFLYNFRVKNLDSKVIIVKKCYECVRK